MAGASLVLVALFSYFGAFPVSALEGKGNASGSALDDDQPDNPVPPPAERIEASDSKLPPSDAKPSSQVGRDAQDAAAEVERQVEAMPVPAAVTAKLAIRDALDRKDVPAAEKLYRAALKQFPLDPDFRAVQEGRALNLHEEKVRAIFGRALADGSRLFGRQWKPGRTMQDDETQVELAVTRRETRAGNAVVAVALTQGYAYIDRGDPARAEKVLTGAIRRHDDYAELYYARVLARGLGGDLKKADEDSLRAVKLSRDHPVTLSQRASLMMAMGRREEAFAWANRALENNPRDAEALAIRGRFLWQDRSRSDLALVALKKAVEINAAVYQDEYQQYLRRFHRERAMSGAFKGDFKQALADADAALDIDPADSLAHMARGLVFEKTGKVEETIKETTLAIKGDPSSKWALFYRAKAMETLGARKQALADLKRAAAIDPGRFRGDYETLLRAQREGAPPLWARKSNDGVLADSN